MYVFYIVCLSTVFGNMSCTPVKGKDFDIGTLSPRLFHISSTEDVALTLDLTNKFWRNLHIASESSTKGLIEILNSNFELHLLMRVTGVLLRNLIYDSKSKDEYAKILGQPTDNLEFLVKAIQSCGVTFNTWTSKAGDLDWTSLSGSELKQVAQRATIAHLTTSKYF